MTDDAKLRLFTALELPQDWLDALARVRANLERVAPGEFKWVRPELMHLTLVFLGHQPEETLPRIQAALSTAGSQSRPFRLSLGRIGAFGPPHALQVVWIGLAEMPAELPGLHRALVTGLSNAGVPFDQKPLVPHITLARGRRPIDREASLRLHSAMQRLKAPLGLHCPVTEFVLMRSTLDRSGPTYHVVSRLPLGDGDG